VQLDLEAGPCDLGRASTVVRVKGTKIELLREGAVAKELIFNAARSAGFVDDE
jgi:tRNA A37 threonylcarbamoyladenosine synthetase subunit TsaC/SUA5/YrdC